MLMTLFENDLQWVYSLFKELGKAFLLDDSFSETIKKSFLFKESETIRYFRQIHDVNFITFFLWNQPKTYPAQIIQLIQHSLFTYRVQHASSRYKNVCVSLQHDYIITSTSGMATSKRFSYSFIHC